jgi:RNA polymerase sigma-70 factor (ECF subfamily)
LEVHRNPLTEDKFVHHEYQPPRTGSSDAEVIARAQAGDESAFEALFRTHQKRIYRLCLRMIGNVAEAEDLTQEAFLQVFRKIRTFRGESAFSTWLHRLAVNVVLMRLRKKKPQEISVDCAPQNEQSERQEWEFATPDLELTGVVDRVSLEYAVSKLADGYREVFLMHDVLGYEHHEIAEALGYSVGNSKSQLHKARMKLRQSLRSKSLKKADGGKLSVLAEFELCK